jgi:hypothetical protein
MNKGDSRSSRSASRELNAEKAARAREGKRKKREEVEEWVRAMAGPGTRTGARSGTTPLPTIEELPERESFVLSQEMICVSLRALSVCLIENFEAEKSKQDAYSRASLYTGVSVKQLEVLWKQWNDAGRRELPPSLLGAGRAAKTTALARMFLQPLRAEVRRIRIKEGRAVEVPMLEKWLLEVHHYKIARGPLTYALHKMGFKFAKTHPLQVRSSSSLLLRSP